MSLSFRRPRQAHRPGLYTSCNSEALNMWLERLSGQSTPSASPPPPQKRSYSPAPHRSSNFAPSNAIRPPYGPRASSLGLVSKANTATASLNSPQLPHGSSLRQQISPPLADVTDPLDVLEQLLGKSTDRRSQKAKDPDGAVAAQKPLEVEEDIDFEGFSLHTFAENDGQQGTNEARPPAAQTVEECEYVHLLKESSKPSTKHLLSYLVR